MVQRRMAQLPLHGGKAPAWLFRRMTQLAGSITMAVVDEFGADEMLRRLSDPWWFQAFGCVLGFDWHSSGVTTVTCGALKEAAKRLGADMGLLVAGGKGGVSRRTPQEIAAAADRLGIATGEQLIDCSRTSAKVDSAAVQDGFTLYQHTFFFTPQGRWCVVQQGLCETRRAARRYHWLGESVDDFVCEPHSAISDLRDMPGSRTKRGSAEAASQPADELLNMVAREADDNRAASVQLVQEHPDRILQEIQQITEGPSLFAPVQHRVLARNINRVRLKQLVPLIHDQMPQTYKQLLSLEGVGPAAVRSLALVAELIYQAPACHRDPAVNPSRDVPGEEVYIEQTEPQDPGRRRWADYAHAHGGKDGTPFPVDCRTYDRNIEVLTEALRRARMGENDRVQALRALGRLTSQQAE